MYILSSYLFLLLGGIMFVWALLIIFSNKFFTWWQDRYWKEENSHHLSVQSIVYNRYGTGIGMLVLSIVIIYSALSF